MFLMVTSKESGKKSYFNFDHVISIVPEKDKTVLTVRPWKDGNIQTKYEITEPATELVAKLNNGGMLQ